LSINKLADSSKYQEYDGFDAYFQGKVC